MKHITFYLMVNMVQRDNHRCDHHKKIIIVSELKVLRFQISEQVLYTRVEG
jgi:hypothetical protein